MFGLKLKVIGLLGLLIVMMGSSFYWYAASSQRKLAELNATIAAAQLALDTQAMTIERLVADNALAAQTTRELGIRYQAARRLVDNVSLGFKDNALSDPTSAAADANLLQARADRCIDLYSGANINEFGLSDEEISATLAVCGLDIR